MELAEKDTEFFEYNIIVRLHEPPEIDGWDKLPTAAKAFISCISGTEEKVYAKNTTTLEMHEWLVIKSDPNGTVGPEIEELAVGRSSDPVNESDTMLNDEVDRAPITSTNRETDTLRVSTFLDKGVANVDVGAGESLSEVGLFAGEYFLNHSLLTNDIDKTENKTATIDVLITYNAA